MLDVDSATDFLIARGLVAADAVVAGDLVVRSAARRNRNLEVHAGAGVGYLLKQPSDPAEGGFETLRAEAGFYAICRDAPPEVRALLPRVAHYDPEAALLAVGWVEGARPLWADYAALGPAAVAADANRALGRALASVHRHFRLDGPGAADRLGWMHREPPWVLSVHRPSPGLLAELSPANYQTLQILQGQPALGTRLDALRGAWRPATAIHGDIKSDNVLAVRPDGDAAEVSVRLVDWELVQVGDPAWDLAGALQDLLVYWTLSMAIGADRSPAALAAAARIPLGAVQAAARALWGGYGEAGGCDPGDGPGLLERAVAFSAARLIQTAYELSHGADGLLAPSVLLLQVADHLLGDPALGQVQLYGIPMRGLPR